MPHNIGRRSSNRTPPSRLAVNVEVDRSAIDAMIDDQVAQQCTASGVAEALNERPVCPRCTLRLDDEVRLVKVERIREAAADAIRGYVTELKAPETAAAIRAYAASLPKTTEVREAVQHVLAVPPKIRAREVLAIFSDDGVNVIVLVCLVRRPHNIISGEFIGDGV